MNMVLIYLGLGAVLLELIIGVQTGFDLALVGLALALGGVIGNIFNNWQIGVGAAGILAIIYIVLGRKFIKSKLSIATTKTNIDELIGKKGTVTKEINLHKFGQVKVGSELWRAESEEKIEKETRIKVISLEGVTLKVVKSD